MGNHVTVQVLVAGALLAAAALLAQQGRQPGLRWGWQLAAVFLAVLGLARLVLIGCQGTGAMEALLAMAVLGAVITLSLTARQFRQVLARAERLAAELARSEQRYRFLLDRLPEAFVVLEEGRVTFANRAFTRIFGITGEQMRGRPLSELVAPEGREAFNRRHDVEITTPSLGVRKLGLEMLTPGGERIWAELRCAVTTFEERPAEVVLISDASQRRQAELRLERLTETILASGGDYGANVQRLVEVCGELLEASCVLYNRLHGELLYTTAGWHVPAGYRWERPAAGQLCFDVIQRGSEAGPLVVERLATTPYAHRDPDVSQFGWATYLGYPVKYRGRSVGSVCALFTEEISPTAGDVRVLQIVAGAVASEEERRWGQEVQRAVSEVATSTQRGEDFAALLATVRGALGRLLEAEHFHVALLDRSTHTISFPLWVGGQSPPAARAWGRGLDDAVLRGGQTVRVDSDQFAALIRAGEVAMDEGRWAQWVGVPLEDRLGPFGVLAAATQRPDLPLDPGDLEGLSALAPPLARALEQLAAEERLRQSEHKYRTLVDRMQDGVFLLQDRKLLFCNQPLARMLGRAVSELEGKELSHLIAPEDRELVLERYRRRLAGEQVTGEYEFRLLHADGHRVEVLMHVGLIDYQGRPASIGTLRDLSERKRLEAQLRQAQRIEALGQLAGGVAHDFNNLLMAIQGSAQLLKKRLGEDELPELTTVLAATQRAAQLTRGLLAFAQRQVLQPQPLDLACHVAQTLPLLRRVIPENIRIDFFPAPTPLVVEVDTGQLDQILMNLAVNSRDAMPEGGRILIRTALVNIDSDYQRTHPWAKLGAHALLQVRDTGAGIDQITLGRIFEPFFTTKALGQGTGLGLPAVYGIVKQHGGMIDVASELGSGTTVDVYLPVVDKRPVMPVVEATGQTPGGRGRILVVEDETEVRNILAEALRAAGYEVLEAEDGAVALDLLLRYDGQIDLVLSDLVMPRMGGRELLESARSHGVEAPFLFSSGYGESFVRRTLGDLAGVGFLAKPYGIDELLHKVGEVMRGTAAQPR